MIADRINLHHKAARNASSAALIVVGALAMYNWVLSPHVGYLRAMQRLVPVVDQVAQERDRICSTLDTKHAELRALRQELTELEEGLFDPTEAKAFMRDLLPLIEKTGCTIVTADFAGKGKTEQAAEPNEPVVIAVSHLSLTLLGQHRQITELLQRVQSNRPKVWIDSCQIDVLDAGSGQFQCDLILTMHTVSPKGGNHNVGTV